MLFRSAMGAHVANAGGDEVPVERGSYGIGVSRRVGAIIEASHDEDGIIWPRAVAPFDAGLANLKVGDAACDKAALDLYESLRLAGIDVLYDDTQERAGAKFANMDLIGLPVQITVGPRGVKAGVVEIKERATGKRFELEPQAALSYLSA